MTVPASEGKFGFGVQSAKGTLATSFYLHNVVRADMGPQQTVEQFPVEVGGILLPMGAYKGMAFAAGTAVMHPRLGGCFGYLLKAASGSYSVTGTGPYTHTFGPPTSYTSMPWLSVRRAIPGNTATMNIGEVMKDCRLARMQLTVAPASVLAATIAFVGREFYLDNGCESWTWGSLGQDANESYTSVPLAHQGTLTVGGTAQKATGVVLDIVNAYTTPQEEMIVGSPHPDDFIIQSQTITITWVNKWQDADLYKRLLTNSADTAGTLSWSPTVHTGAVELEVTSPSNIPGKTVPYSLTFTASQVAWRADGPPELIGGGWLQQRYVGVVQADPSQTQSAWSIELVNMIATY